MTDKDCVLINKDNISKKNSMLTKKSKVSKDNILTDKDNISKDTGNILTDKNNILKECISVDEDNISTDEDYIFKQAQKFAREKYNCTLKFINIILTEVLGKDKEIRKLTDFKDISHDDLIQKDIEIRAKIDANIEDISL